MGSRARYGSVSQKGGHLHSRVEAAAETGGRLLRLPLSERGAARAAPAAVLESRNGCRRGGAGFRGGIKKQADSRRARLARRMQLLVVALGIKKVDGAPTRSDYRPFMVEAATL